MKTFRSVLFWMHLAAGLIAGLAIGIMCFTGTMLAFEQELVAWAERDARRVTPPSADAVRLSLEDLVRKAREARPEAPIASLAVSPEPTMAVVLPLGREGALYANPYTGEIRTPASARLREFMRTMTDWHRYLARTGDNRPVGKAINGACNLAFCVLALSGLYLWMPRTWSWRGVKAVAALNVKLSGKARDFNWHNAIGLWCAPILIILTLTAVPISYRWGANLIYRIAGEEVPAPPNPGAPGAAPSGQRSNDGGLAVAPPAEGAAPLNYDAMLAAARRIVPDASLVTLNLGGGRAVRPVTATIRQPGLWPRTATTVLTLDPYTGAQLKREGYAELPTSRQIRAWTRFLHTGQALGWWGQLLAGLACLGGCFLVYTGFALSWRRFFPGKMKIQTSGPSA